MRDSVGEGREGEINGKDEEEREGEEEWGCNEGEEIVNDFEGKEGKGSWGTVRDIGEGALEEGKEEGGVVVLGEKLLLFCLHGLTEQKIDIGNNEGGSIIYQNKNIKRN